MYLIVVGAGQIGTPLLKIATSEGHEVVVIERDEQRAAAAAREFDCLVLHRDATSRETLEEAGGAEADALIAITDQDAVNIMVCLLAQEVGIGQVVSVVRDSEHMNIFRQIGVEIMENPQRLIAEHLFRSVTHPGVSDYMRLATGGEVVEVEVAEGADIAGLTLAEAGERGVLPKDVLVVAIERNGDETAVAQGATRIDAGDRLVVFSVQPLDSSVMDAFGAL